MGAAAAAAPGPATAFVSRMIPKSGHRAPTFAKPASTGEARSGQMMREAKATT
jgi:hypothetical protein